MQPIPTNGVAPVPAPRYIDYPDQILKDVTKVTVIGGGVVVTLASCVYGPQARRYSTRNPSNDSPPLPTEGGAGEASPSGSRG